jgi:hypothetical protein
MTKRFTDVIVRYDPSLNVVSVKPANGASLPEEFSTFQVGELETLELVNGVGESIVAYLNSVYPGVFVDEEAQRSLEADEPASETFMMARKMIAKIGDTSSVEDVAAVESLLERVSKAGDEAASDYLNGPWQSLKAVLLRRVGRNGG